MDGETTMQEDPYKECSYGLWRDENTNRVQLRRGAQALVAMAVACCNNEVTSKDLAPTAWRKERERKEGEGVEPLGRTKAWTKKLEVRLVEGSLLDGAWGGSFVGIATIVQSGESYNWVVGGGAWVHLLICRKPPSPTPPIIGPFCVSHNFTSCMVFSVTHTICEGPQLH